ncbi:MAG: hypothetical protein BA867_09125 [Desulfobacterales bacterium S5133MH16]|nr:MAG: hypothetical protein BA867_09125 [Desulfobacterales bacterium S5133MH16]
MVIIKFINKYSDAPKMKILLYSILSGISYALALAIINAAMLHVSTGNDTLKISFLLLFVIFCLLHIYFKKYFMNKGVKLTENVIRNVREDITGKIRCSELEVIENMGKGSIYTCLTEDTEAISQSAPSLIIALESMFCLCAGLFYIIYLSFYGFIFIIILVFIMFFVYTNSSDSVTKKLKISKIEETEFFDRLNDVLSGFKEIRINCKKNRDLFADIVSVSEKSAKLKTDAEIGLDNRLVLFVSLFFIMLIGTIFIFPVFGIMEKDLITRLVSSLLFLWGPMAMLFVATRQYNILLVSIANINKLEATLDNFNPRFPDKQPEPPTDFTEIALNSVEFCYKNKKGEMLFKMGPIDFSFKKGEIIFITGGNGSGKSTLMKLLTGLYYPEPGGAVTIGEERITSETYPSYRELFSTIFTDFHIFEKLYGLKDIDEEKVNDLLRQMEINHKTEYIEEKFTNIKLSTGQRKRLAYITTLLEDKQVYVFDEWAADQDPEFRKKFYNKFLNDMRVIGKTVIAVSHDDRYFHTADRIVKIEEGKTVTA